MSALDVVKIFILMIQVIDCRHAAGVIIVVLEKVEQNLWLVKQPLLKNFNGDKMDNEIKVFICHSSNDKKRFVEELAVKLVNDGFNVFYDDWELNYGDSLIKLFDKIDEADVFLIVLSEYSVESKWVKAELSAGFIRKIEEETKVIPIVIDNGVEVPSSLKHIKQCRINDVNDYEEVYKELCHSMLGISNKPQRGNKPNYASSKPIDGLNILDSLIIKKLGNSLHYKNNMFSFEELVELTENEFSEEDLFESVQVLEESYMLDCRYGLGSRLPYSFKLTPGGIMLYGINYEENMGNYIKDIVSTILNYNVHSNDEIYEKTNAPKFIINALLDLFIMNGYIKGSKTTSGTIIIYGISGNGKRQLKNMLD